MTMLSSPPIASTAILELWSSFLYNTVLRLELAWIACCDDIKHPHHAEATMLSSMAM